MVVEADITTKAFNERVKNFKKEYSELLKKYGLEVVGCANHDYGISGADLWLYDIGHSTRRADFYEIDEDRATMYSYTSSEQDLKRRSTMTKQDSLDILKGIYAQIDSMTDDQFSDFLMKNSTSFKEDVNQNIGKQQEQ